MTVRRERRGSRTASTCRGGVGVVEQRDEVGVVAEVVQLVGDVPVVDVDRHRARLVTARASPRGARPSCAGRGRRDRRCRTPAVAQRVGEAGRALVELGVGAPVGRRTRRASRSGTASATHSNRSAMLNSTRPASGRHQATTIDSAHETDLTHFSCGPTASCRRSATRPPSSWTSSSSGCGRGCGRSPAARRSWRAPGDFLEYSIGDDSIVVVRTATAVISPRSTTRAGTAARGWPKGAAAFAQRRDPVPVPRVDVRARRPARARARPRGVRRSPDRSRPAAGARRVLGRVRVRQHGSRRRAVARIPRSAPDAARAVPLRRAAFPHLPLHDHPRELESGRRRVQRELPRAGTAPADPSVDRRHEHRVRAVRTALALRPASRRAARAATEPAPRPAATTTTTKARSSARWSPGSAARSSARSAPRSPSSASRVRPPVRRCSARIRSGA